MRKFRSALSLLIAFAMVFSCFTVFSAEGDATNGEIELVTTFSDVDPSSIVGGAITDLALLGVINGRPDGTFGPDENITRAEFSAIIVRLSNLASALGDDAVTGFADLDADETYKWARPYIKTAKDMGLMNGYSDGSFGAGDPVTYEQVIAVLMRMHNWGTVCQLEYEANPSMNWSAPYLKYANSEGLTKNALSGQAAPSQATTRGIVAILADNSRSLVNMVSVTDPITGKVNWQREGQTSGNSGSGSGSGSGGGSGKGGGNNNDDDIVTGVVTATYLAYLDKPRSELSKNEIMVDDDVYTLSRNAASSVDLYDILGKKVRMVCDYYDDEYVTSISATDYTSTKIYSGYIGDRYNFYLGIEDGKIAYASNAETFRTSYTAPRGDVIFNGKLIENFDYDDLSDPNSPYYFSNGVIEICENGKYNFVKISNYDTYVANGTTSRNNIDYITLKYKYDEDENVNSDNRIQIPVNDDADYFTFRRGNTDLSEKTSVKSEIKSYDVINILRSPDDAEGPTVMKVEISRKSVTNQRVSSINTEDNTMFLMGDRYYQYNNSYKNIVEMGDEEVPDLQRGSTGVNLYLDYIGTIAAVTISATGDDSGSYAYGYLVDALQDAKDSDYNLQVLIIDTNGKSTIYGATDKIQIDGKRYNDDDNEIMDILEEGANLANESYLNTSAGADLENATYAQPVRYKINSKKLLTAIDTLRESNIDGKDLVLSARIDDSTADDGLRTYSRSSGFPYITENGDEDHFNISTTTKILFVPDDRSKDKKYGKRTSSTFTAGNKYYVEAFNVGTTATKRADFVLLYKVDDSMLYNSKTPFMIVTNYGTNDNDEEFIKGYVGNYNGGGGMDTVDNKSYSTVIVNYSRLDSDAREAYDNIGKGDIVRYLITDGKVTDLELWLDASDPVQDEPVGSVREAIEKRILAIKSNSSVPEATDAYNAAFRLAYGTVLRHETDVDSITVSPTIVEDDVEMADAGTGVASHLYGKNTRVFIYNGRSGAEYISDDNAMDDLQAYEDGSDGSVVVTYTSGDSSNSATYFKMIYIIH